jgi:hypothetical protein
VPDPGYASFQAEACLPLPLSLDLDLLDVRGLSRASRSLGNLSAVLEGLLDLLLGREVARSVGLELLDWAQRPGQEGADLERGPSQRCRCLIGANRFDVGRINRNLLPRPGLQPQRRASGERILELVGGRLVIVSHFDPLAAAESHLGRHSRQSSSRRTEEGGNKVATGGG